MKSLRHQEIFLENKIRSLEHDKWNTESIEELEEIKHFIKKYEKELSEIRLTLYMNTGV